MWRHHTAKHDSQREMAAAAQDLSLTELMMRIGVALVCGAVIGLERQWRQRSAGLRTYALVALGSALFVILAALTAGEASPTRVAAQVVAGVGFLGAGVIMKNGLSVQGLNTAGTIWCSAAVGVLAGAGKWMPAFAGTASVLFVNVALRPLAAAVSQRPVDAGEQAVHYVLKILCGAERELFVRSLLVQLLGTSPLMLHSLEHGGHPENSELSLVEAHILGGERRDGEMEQIVTRLGLEPQVHGVSWRVEPCAPEERGNRGALFESRL